MNSEYKNNITLKSKNVIIFYTQKRKLTVVYSLLIHDCTTFTSRENVQLELTRPNYMNRNEILLGSQGTVNQTTPGQHKLSQKNMQHIGEVRSC